MVFQWFPMVANHWSDDGMVTIHRSGLDHTYGGSSLNLLLFHLHQSDMCGKFRVQICFNDVWFSAVSKGARLSICGHWSWNSLSLKDTMYWGQPVPGQWRSSDSFWYHQAITEIFGVFTERAFSLIWVSCHLFWIPKNSAVAIALWMGGVRKNNSDHFSNLIWEEDPA